jgi:hypothetical protein
VLGFLFQGKDISEYLGLFLTFCETLLTDTISVLGGLKESVFRVEMHRERKQLSVQD